MRRFWKQVSLEQGTYGHAIRLDGRALKTPMRNELYLPTKALADAVLRAHYANPSSLYAPGAQSEFVLSGARETVAASLGAQPGEIVFTAQLR